MAVDHSCATCPAPGSRFGVTMEPLTTWRNAMPPRQECTFVTVWRSDESANCEDEMKKSRRSNSGGSMSAAVFTNCVGQNKTTYSRVWNRPSGSPLAVGFWSALHLFLSINQLNKVRICITADKQGISTQITKHSRISLRRISDCASKGQDQAHVRQVPPVRSNGLGRHSFLRKESS